jgi:hypothetical protein
MTEAMVQFTWQRCISGRRERLREKTKISREMMRDDGKGKKKGKN